jgi:anti-anti-sigma regulatory factor
MDYDGPIRLPAHCSTVTADDLRVRLVLAAELGDGIAVDASEVESIGQAVIQLLIAARAEAEREGGTLTIDHPSPAFADRLARCGLADAIGLSSDDKVFA